MRISDWSSDVCSSDLPHAELGGQCHQQARVGPPGQEVGAGEGGGERHVEPRRIAPGDADAAAHRIEPLWVEARSEEHTSELQSLMRISYAVFCLKKTNHTKHANMKIQ